MQSYEVYAIRYGRHERLASANFIGGDPHDGPMPLDYFVWAIVGAGKTYVVDTGFNPESARKRGREALRSPAEGLQAIGIDPAQVADVIVTHMHYDHAGNFDLFANATYHIQEREMAYCTGRCMCHPALRNSFETDDVAAMVRTVMFITHSVDEAVYLADRVIVMTRRPGRIREIIDVAEFRSSERWSERRVEETMVLESFVHLRTYVWKLLRETA